MKNGLRMLCVMLTIAMIFTVAAPVIALADEADTAADMLTSVAPDSVENVLLTAPVGDETTDEVASDATASDTTTVTQENPYGRDNSYENFLKKYGNSAKPDTEIIIPAKDYVAEEGATPKVETYEGKDDILVWDSQEGKITWQVEIAEAGLYNMAMSYVPFLDNALTISFEMKIDGLTQFNSMKSFEFNRVFKNETNDFEMDNRGNQLRPEQIQLAMWQENVFNDAEGIYIKGFYFYFTEGTHTITLEATGAGVAIEHLKLFQIKDAGTYEEYLAQNGANGVFDTKGETIEIEGEKATLKSDSTLAPQNDRSDPKVQPYSPSKIMMNSIGGSKWATPGQWAQWEFDVEAAGWYKIGIRYAQNYLRGMSSIRTLRLDGEVPFIEAEEVKFDFTSTFELKVVGDDNPYYFYLEPGKHTIQLEVTLGDMATSINNVENCVYEMNYLYRKIIMITSAEPDQYRNYKLDVKINDLIPRLKEISRILKQEYNAISAAAGGKGNEAVVLEQVYVQLDSFVEKPYTISKRLSAYKENITTLSAWLLNASSQPIGVDYLLITPAGEEFKNTQANGWDKLVHEVRAFIASFTEDYTSIGNTGEGDRTVTVWITTGRDQANVLKPIIDDDFTPKTNIGIDLKLVQTSLVSAIAAKRAPDVCLASDAMNLAYRGALMELSQFDTFDEVVERFHPSSMLLFNIEDKYYALPEAQTFSMLFYRTDILEELGMEVPQTWDDIYDMLPIVQRNNMDIGMLDTFFMQFHQAGINEYNEDYTAVNHTTKESIDLFVKYTDLFTQYKLPNSYDFFNRFRTGEMPVAMAPYNVATQIQAAAPEISGLWGMTLIPGTIKEDGTIDRTQTFGSSANIMLAEAKDPEAAWMFLDWYTSAKTQAEYANELEATMGMTARYATANLEAFEMLNWSKADAKSIREQRQWGITYPSVPGGYYVSRNYTNAFNAVISANEAPRAALTEWTQQTNAELVRKRIEFGIDELWFEAKGGWED